MLLLLRRCYSCNCEPQQQQHKERCELLLDGCWLRRCNVITTHIVRTLFFGSSAPCHLVTTLVPTSYRLLPFKLNICAAFYIIRGATRLGCGSWCLLAKPFKLTCTHWRLLLLLTCAALHRAAPIFCRSHVLPRRLPEAQTL